MTAMWQAALTFFSWVHGNKDEALFWATTVLAVATFVVALYTAKLARETKKLRQGTDAAMVEQISYARRAAAASEQSAIAAQTSAHATKVLVEVGQRPWVLMAELHIDAEDKQLTANTRLQIKVVNLGNTPALGLKLYDFLQVQYGALLPDPLMFL